MKKIFLKKNIHLYSIITICLINIIFSYIIKYYLNLSPCIACLILLGIFFFILILSLIINFIDYKKISYFLITNNIFSSILGIYISFNKIFINNQKFIEIKSCTGILDSIDILNKIQKFFIYISQTSNFCSLDRKYFLGIQFEWYIMASFFLIICLNIFYIKKQ